MRLCTIVSGSSGNCTYVDLGGQGILVDAGLSGKRLQQGLSTMNLPNPSAILITHEHSDHIAGAGVLARRFNIPIYATPLTWRYFLRHKKLGLLKEEQVKHIVPGEPVMLGGAKVTAFDVLHDASQPVGYTFESENKKIALATDLGKATDTVLSFLQYVVHLIGQHLRLVFEECTCVFVVRGHLIRMRDAAAKFQSGFGHEQITDGSSNDRPCNDIRPGMWTVSLYIRVCVHFPSPFNF